MSLQIAPTLKRRTADKWVAALVKHLYPGEVIWALASTTAMYPPPRDGLAVTNARVLAFASRDVGTAGLRNAVDADNIYSFDIHNTSKTLLITTRMYQQLSFGMLHDDDVAFVSHYVHHLAATGFPAGMREAIAAQRRAEAARVDEEQQLEREREAAKQKAEQERAVAAQRKADEHVAAAQRKADERVAAKQKAEQERAAAAQRKADERAAAKQKADEEKAAAEADRVALEHRRSQVEVFGPRVTGPAWRYLEEHSRPDEWPWFVIASDTMGGVLAAFEDRLMIVKVGGYTSMMAGSFGGGRVTTFPYTDITNIEFNGGIVNGVLEVLTPSYQGTGQHDYWRSSHVGRNRAADSPFTLSNCLPLGKSLYKKALPRLNELQRTIAESKRPNIVVQQTPAQSSTDSGDLAGQLQQLADLYSLGVLDAAEFAAAKQAAIKKHT